MRQRYCNSLAVYLSSSSECQNHASLTEANRKETFTGVLLCDNSLGPNWFRFQGAAGNKMAATCVPTNRCGTHATGWLNGVHPTVSEAIVTRQVCFNWSGGCCNWSINIQVRNCNGYFVYYISGTPPVHPCHLRYCGADQIVNENNTKRVFLMDAVNLRLISSSRIFLWL